MFLICNLSLTPPETAELRTLPAPRVELGGRGRKLLQAPRTRVQLPSGQGQWVCVLKPSLAFTLFLIMSLFHVMVIPIRSISDLVIVKQHLNTDIKGK